MIITLPPVWLPGLVVIARPRLAPQTPGIYGGINLQKIFQTTLLFGMLAELEPRAGIGGLDMAMLRSRASTWTITQSPGTGWGVEKGGFRQKVAPTHPEATEKTFDHAHQGGQWPNRPKLSMSRIKSWMVAPN